jgi:XisI protein
MDCAPGRVAQTDPFWEKQVLTNTKCYKQKILINLHFKKSIYYSMDTLRKWQNVIAEFIAELADIPYANAPDLSRQPIIDRDGNHFQLMVVGWDKGRFACDIILHFDIKGDKVWIQRNNTELMVGDELVERGIPKDHIVLGYKSPFARPYTGFAVA